MNNKHYLETIPRGEPCGIMYYYIYVLRSLKDNNFYTGYTSNLENRVLEHQKGKVKFTKHRLPLELVYFEGCINQQDATSREKYLKTTYGKRYIKNRIKEYLETIPQGESRGTECRICGKIDTLY